MSEPSETTKNEMTPEQDTPLFKERAIESIRLATMQPEKAAQIAEAVLTEAQAENDWSGIAWGQMATAGADYALGHFAEAIQMLESSLSLGRTQDDSRLMGYCYHYIGASYFSLSDYSRALEFVYQAVALRRTLDNDLELTTSLGAVGAIHGTLGNYDDAAASFTEALEIARRNDDIFGQAVNLANIGRLRYKIDPTNEEAITCYAESVRLTEEIGEAPLRANTLTNWAEALTTYGKLDDALAMALRAVQTADETSVIRFRVNARLQLASIFIQKRQWENVERILQETEKEADRGNIRGATPRLPMVWGEYQRARGDLNLAYDCFLRARDLVEKYGEKEGLATVERELADIAENNNQPAVALRHFRAYHDLQSKLEKQAAQNVLMAHHAKMMIEKAHQDAELARAEIELARLRTSELLEANRQKDLLLTQLQQQASKLARQAIEDPLTGLYNRRYLMEFLEQELPKAQQLGYPVTIVIADLDNFKKVNDRFTHAVGDEVLKITARILQLSCRRGDVVARYGGEEFVVVLPATDAAGAEILCERIRQGVESYHWYEFDPNLQVTISLGIADESGEPADRLLALADRRQYQAKHDGKNRVVSRFTERVSDLAGIDSLPQITENSDYAAANR